MKNLTLRSVILLVALSCVIVGVASANNLNATLQPIVVSHSETGTPANTNVPFPTAGDAFCAFTSGCGNIPAGGQTDFMWTTGDFVISSIFVLPTNSVTDLTANWIFQDFLGGGNTETWFAYVNGTAVAMATLPDDNFLGQIGTVKGTVNFAGIAPVGGGYQVELILQNTIGFAGGSAAWQDGGITGLSYNQNGVPEPGSLALFGSGVVGLAGLLRRKLGV